jgi:hypothetical protein
VITKISIVPDAKTQFKLQFNFVKPIEDMAMIRALIERGAVEMANAVSSAGAEEDHGSAETFDQIAPASGKF